MTGNTGVLAVSVAAIATFVVAFQMSGLVARVHGVITVASETLAVMGEKALDDATKERLVQRATVRLLKNFLAITLLSVLVLTAPGIVIWAGAIIGVAPIAAVSDFLLAWQVIIGASFALLIVAWLLRRR